MIHVLYFITRKPMLTDAEFHRYWREVHGPIAKNIKQSNAMCKAIVSPFLA